MLTNQQADTDVRLQLLVVRCQAGDERAFAQLLDQFGGKTRRYLFGLVGDDADDVQQEVWLTVYRSIASLANPAAFRTWLFSTTRRRALDLLRKRRREAELLAADSLGEMDVDAVPDEAALREISDGGIDDLLAGLPPPQREVLLLRFQDDMSYAEIAVVVGCPVGTVKTRIHHAKRRLQELIRRDK